MTAAPSLLLSCTVGEHSFEDCFSLVLVVRRAIYQGAWGLKQSCGTNLSDGASILHSVLINTGEATFDVRASCFLLRRVIAIVTFAKIMKHES